MIPAMAGPGGAERTMSYLIEYLTARHEVALLTLESGDSIPFFSLPDSVTRIRLNKLGGRGPKRLVRVLSRPWYIRQEVLAYAPDVVLSFMDTMNVMALIGCSLLQVPVIVSERNDPRLHRIGRLKELLRDSIYPLAHSLVVQTERVGRYFAAMQGKLSIIPNPVPAYAICAEPDLPDADGRLRIVAVGRLEPHKGFDRLIQAFARIAEAYPNWDLHIIGEGRLRAKLEKLASKHCLDGRVRMPGIIHDVVGELAVCHLMAFPSQYEGFPNALAEGLAIGLPAIGLRGVSGVEELILHQETGLLVEEKVESLAAALAALMQSAAKRRAFGNAGRRHMLNWTSERILGMWEKLLLQAAAANSKRAIFP